MLFIAITLVIPLIFIVINVNTVLLFCGHREQYCNIAEVQADLMSGSASLLKASSALWILFRSYSFLPYLFVDFLYLFVVT